MIIVRFYVVSAVKKSIRVLRKKDKEHFLKTQWADKL